MCRAPDSVRVDDEAIRGNPQVQFTQECLAITKQMYYLTEIRVDDFEQGVVPAQGRFKVVSPCSDPRRRSSAAVFEAVQGMEKIDQRQALAGLKYLLKLAQLGKPFGQLEDKKAVHEAFEPFYCELTKRDETVWRYRHGDIRILFYYAVDKVAWCAKW